MSKPGKSIKYLFSGRFEPPHPGHWVSVLRLLEKGANQVVIVVLDYPGRKHPASYAAQIFKEMIDLSNFNESVSVVCNKTHFGKIGLPELKTFNCDVYVSGNMDVLKHVDDLGVSVKYIDRAYDYAASNYVLKTEGAV